jgi:hypothetical protein
VIERALKLVVSLYVFGERRQQNEDQSGVFPLESLDDWILRVVSCVHDLPQILGYSNVNDYQDNQLGIQAGHGGGIMVEGSWYCPLMPKPLVEASIDYRVKKTIDEVTWKKRIAARTPYMLHSKESPDSDGYQPLRCPAVGASVTVACPLRAESMKGERVVLRSRVAAPPKHADRICRQTSVSFPPSAGAKYRQDI